MDVYWGEGGEGGGGGGVNLRSVSSQDERIRWQF